MTSTGFSFSSAMGATAAGAAPTASRASQSRARNVAVKKGAADGRRARQEQSSVIRKQKKDDALLKRRNLGELQPSSPSTLATSSSTPSTPPPSSQGGLRPSAATVPTVEEIASLVPRLRGAGGADDVLVALKRFRKLLSLERSPPIDAVLDAGVVPDFVAFLRSPDEAYVFEAAWSLTNIASGTAAHTRAVVDAQTIPLFIALLASPSADVREQAVWALGNIAGDRTSYRDAILEAGGMPAMMSIIVPTASKSLLRNATWALSNLCRGKPQPRWELVREALPLLTALVRSPDAEIVTDTLWALSYLTDNGAEQLADFLTVTSPAHTLRTQPLEQLQARAASDAVLAGVLTQASQGSHPGDLLPFVIEQLGASSLNVQSPALRTVGNIVTGNDEQTQLTLDNGLLRFLGGLMNSPKKSLVKEACWTLSNITAGSRAQIDLVVAQSNGELVTRACELLQRETLDIRRECLWTVSNAVTSGNRRHVAAFVNAGCLDGVCELLSHSDANTVKTALETVQYILQSGAGDATNPYVEMVEQCDGLEAINALQDHEQTAIYELAVTLLETYFGGEEIDDVTVFEPQTVTNSSGVTAFSFAAPTQAVQQVPNFSF